MARDLVLGYHDGDSPLHRIDPLTKLIALIGVIIFAVGAPIDYNGWMLLGLFAIAPASGVDLKTFLRPWSALIPLWVPFILLPPVLFHLQRGFLGLANDTAHLVLFGHDIAYSRYGLTYGLKIAARGSVIGIASLLVLWTTHPRDLVQALVQELRAPYKYAWAVFLALIYVPIVQHETQIRGYALHIRGVQYRRLSLRGLRLLAIPVIFRSLRRGFATALSMEARGFGVAPTRVFRNDLRYPKPLRILRAAVVIAAAILIGLAIRSGRFAVMAHS
jgi:energy-coupling factor transport system permease protein